MKIHTMEHYINFPPPKKGKERKKEKKKVTNFVEKWMTLEKTLSRVRYLKHGKTNMACIHLYDLSVDISN